MSSTIETNVNVLVILIWASEIVLSVAMFGRRCFTWRTLKRFNDNITTMLSKKMITKGTINVNTVSTYIKIDMILSPSGLYWMAQLSPLISAVKKEWL